MLRKLSLTVIGFALIGLAWGQDTISKNGTDWNRQSDDAKISYIMGYMDGYATAWTAFKVSLESYLPLDAKILNNLTPQQRFNLITLHNLKHAEPPDSVTFGQLETAINTFYSDSRNAPVCWSAATTFAIESLAGSSPNEITLELARKADAKLGCEGNKPPTSPSAKEPSLQNSNRKPHVFLEVWDTGGVTRPERETGPLETETQLLAQTCPLAIVTVEPQNSDFTFRLAHHLSGVALLAPDNPPPDYYRDYYQWSLINKNGEIIQSGSDDSLPGAIKQACGALMKN